jgi:hypothetical protein
VVALIPVAAWRNVTALASLAGCLTLLGGCGGAATSPTSPSTPATTRIIGFGDSSLAFGDVTVGRRARLSLAVTNTGSAVLTITSVSAPGGAYKAYLKTGDGTPIQPGQSQSIPIEFAPTAAQSYNGILTFNGDQTGGTSTILVSGTGTLPLAEPAPFSATSGCFTCQAGTFVSWACWVVASVESREWELQVTADLRAFGLSQTRSVARCMGPCGQPEWDLDLHIPADMAAGPVSVPFTVSDAAGHAVVTTATMQITR